MKILFIDWAPFAYDSDSPLTKPLGGTQSAAAYLSAALAALGHEVALVNQVETERVVQGVLFTQLPKPTAWINSFDIVISVSGLHAETLRSVGCSRPVVAWCQHDVNQGAVAQLSDPAYRAMYAGFAMVSEWQRQEYIRAFGLDPQQAKVKRNAMSPPFTVGARDWRWLEGERAPVLTYTSTPFRGLDVLLMAFPMIRRAIPDARLRIHGGMKIYTKENADKPFLALYELARALPGVENIGPVGQSELAQSLRQTDILAYPCTFRETSCISAMEAGGSGLLMVTTAFGSLPETTGGFGRLLEAANPAERGNLGMFATRYAEELLAIYRHAIEHPDETRRHLVEQMAHFQANNTWANRAVEWQSWLQALV